MIEGIRKAIGPDIQLLIDAHALYNVPTAIRLATRLSEYDICWFEEPCPPESYDALQTVRNQVPTRICVGERLYTRFEFLPVLQRHLTDYVMPDVTWTGGIEARRVKLDFYNAFLEAPLKIEGDALIVPKTPGLGVKIDVDYLKAHEVTS